MWNAVVFLERWIRQRIMLDGLLEVVATAQTKEHPSETPTDEQNVQHDVESLSTASDSRACRTAVAEGPNMMLLHAYA